MFLLAFRAKSLVRGTFANKRSSQSLSTVPQWQAVPAANSRSLLEHFRMGPFADTIRRLSSTDGGAVLDLRRGILFRVNPLGARVMDLLDQGDSPERIAEKLSAEFQVALSEVQSDVSGFIGSLKAHGVIDAR
jgi:hypothetical protein